MTQAQPCIQLSWRPCGQTGLTDREQRSLLAAQPVLQAPHQSWGTRISTPICSRISDSAGTSGAKPTDQSTNHSGGALQSMAQGELTTSAITLCNGI